MSVQPADLQTLHFGTTVLRNLIYHRDLILEPIRRLAFRNMRHLSDAMAAHHVPADAEVGSAEFKEWVRELQDQMLRNQGSEPSELDRVLIEIATFTPVKLYLGLLYAEIEYLDERAGEHPLSGNQGPPRLSTGQRRLYRAFEAFPKRNASSQRTKHTF